MSSSVQTPTWNVSSEQIFFLLKRTIDLDFCTEVINSVWQIIYARWRKASYPFSVHSLIVRFASRNSGLEWQRTTRRPMTVAYSLKTSFLGKLLTAWLRAPWILRNELSSFPDLICKAASPCLVLNLFKRFFCFVYHSRLRKRAAVYSNYREIAVQIITSSRWKSRETPRLWLSWTLPTTM